MKKTLIAFLCTFIALPAVADNYIKFKASAIEDTINTIVPESHRASAADEYQKQMDSTTGKISVLGIYKVCAAAGFNINNTNGYNGCRLFINTIAEKSGFGFGSANQQNCKTKFNGIWALSPDGKQYQCVGKDGHKLVYHASCDGAGGDCIPDFSSLQTQEPNAREFIQAYGKQKNLQFTCWYTFDESRWQINNPIPQDYIRCSAGGKAYEFEFDDLIQDPGKTAVESENTVLCEMFGGKIVKHPDDSIEKQWQSCEVSKEICNGPLHNLAIKIGHNVMYQGYCRLSRTVEKISVVGLKTLPGVDSRVFYNTGAQMRAGMAKDQTEEYLRTKFPNETYINCDPNPKILNEGFGIDRDYVMTCTVGGKQVDFIFHDLTEGNDARAATGMDAMQCIINGGTFKGESCRGPTQAECDALDAALRAKGSSEGAKWDDDVRACIMGNAMKTYKRDVTTGYIVGAVVIVGGTIAVIGTGGAAAPAIIGGAEMLVTDLAINWAIDANHRRLSKGAATRFGDFIEDADKCTDEQCALQVLKKHYKSLSGVIDDLNTEDHATIDAVMDRLIGLVQTEFVACGIDDAGQVIMASPADCAMQKSRLRAIDYFGEWTEFALVVGSIAIPAGYFTNKFMKMKKISKVAKDLNVTYKDAKQLIKAGDVVQDASGVITKADGSSQKVIGFLDEGFMPSVKMDDFITDLEKEGYRIEYNGDYMGKKTYKIFADADKDADIELIQKQLLKNASDNDKDARLAAVGMYYDPRSPDSWYDAYKEMTTTYLLNDPDVAAAQRNWSQMSEWEKYKFTNQTNRKIRHLISEDPLPVSYKRPDAGAAASYGPQRMGTKQTKELENGKVIDYDTYYFNPNQDFEDVLGDIVHENYHYSQDIGKAETPKWLLDYNMDNYTGSGSGFIGEYHVQPIEIGVKPLGRGVSSVLAKRYFVEKIDDIREVGIVLQEVDDVSLRQLGESMVSFLDTKTYESYRKFYQSVKDIKADPSTQKEVIEYLNSFDNFNFWNKCRDLVRR